ncbi:MAG: ABC transporter ATP-binding protein, partial [Bdellovibrionota bacterium]
MIEVKGVSKRFGEILALDNISLTVEKGQIVGFLGANGAGKTTTMDIICGCSGPDSGTVEICGHDIVKEPLIAKQKLGYLPDIPPLYPEMKVEEAITFTAKLRKVPSDKQKEAVNKAINALSLESVRNRLVGNLSKGFRQRVAFAKAIVHDPEVLILDEPTEGLDPNQIAQMRELIRSLKGDHTIM